MFSDEDSDPFDREAAEKERASDNEVIPPSPTTLETLKVSQKRSPKHIVRIEVAPTTVARQNDTYFSDEEDIFELVENTPRAAKRRSSTAYDSFDDSFEQENEPKPPKRKPSIDVANDSFDEEVEIVTSPVQRVNCEAVTGPILTGEALLCDSFDSFDNRVQLTPTKNDPFDDSFENPAQDEIIPAKDDSFDDDGAVVQYDPSKVPSFGQITEEYTLVEKQMQAIDELAQQLKLAVALQKDAETSQLSGQSLFPWRLEGRHLSSGSHLLLLNIENKSQTDLRDWQLTISRIPIGKNKHVTSRSLDLGHIPVSGKSCVEVMTSCQGYEPSLYEIELHRMFEVDSLNSVFRIPLGCEFFSSLNQLSPRQDNEILDNKRFSSTFCVSLKLVQLLCAGNLDKSSLLSHLLTPSSIKTDSQPANLSISQLTYNFVVEISAKDPTIRKTLKRDLQLYIILSVSKHNAQLNDDIVLDYSSIDKLYDSVVSSF